MGNSKIIFYGETLMDLTGDTVTKEKMLKGITAHDKAGDPITGTCEFDSDTSDATANVDDLLAGETAYARGAKLTGTMPNRGAAAGEIASKDGEYTIELGYHDGSGKVGIAAAEKLKLIAGNIKKDVTLLGVKGTYGGESVTAQSKNATPAKTAQTIVPDEGYDYLSEVVIAAVPYTSAANAAGGMTVTIGA